MTLPSTSTHWVLLHWLHTSRSLHLGPLVVGFGIEWKIFMSKSILISSSNKRNFQVIVLLMSFMIRLLKKGCRSHPCGTPEVTDILLDRLDENFILSVRPDNCWTTSFSWKWNQWSHMLAIYLMKLGYGFLYRRLVAKSRYIILYISFLNLLH